ncbi:MAG: 3-hydroxyacyl-CoA dehydrogenase NAD-binding domain-containing protein [Calditrichia bacterium]
MTSIKRVAILGAGVSGGQLAALFSNAGFETLLYDLTQELVEEQLKHLQETVPSPFFSARCARKVKACNYREHLAELATVDWVIESIVERPEAKQELFASIAKVIRPDAIISTNTSGLSVNSLSGYLPVASREYFCSTHFLNPPRYRELVEIIQAEETLPEVIELLEKTCRERLGKQVLFASDTPYFVANRIGVHAIMSALNIADDMSFNVSLADALTGAALGRADAAVFRMADLIGLDTLVLMSTNISGALPADAASDVFEIPEYMRLMISRDWLGTKTKQGFYKEVNGLKETLNRASMEYEPYDNPVSSALELAAEYHTTPGKISEIVDYPDAGGEFTWRWLSSVFLYAANRIPEVSRDILTIDQAMKWGFGWELGPFELWDAIGVEKMVDRMRADGRDIPEWIEAMLHENCYSFYKIDSGQSFYFDTYYGEIQPIIQPDNVLRLNLLKEQCNILEDNWGASLVDIGDGVLCVEFHSIAPIGTNPIDSATLDILEDGLELLESGDYVGLVLANESQHFSNGLNLPALIKLIQEKRWDTLERRSKRYQDIAQALRYTPYPIVAAPHHYTTFQGLELALACDKRTAFSELYCGFTDIQLGLLPFGSGILQILRNYYLQMKSENPGPFPPVRKAFDWFWQGNVSSSALEALEEGLLRNSDRIILNRRYLLATARNLVVEMAATYSPPSKETTFILPGEPGRLVLQDAIDQQVQIGQVDAHTGMLANKLAFILCGGNSAGTLQPITEQMLLDLEREAFLQICSDPATLPRLLSALVSGSLPQKNLMRGIDSLRDKKRLIA